MKKLFLPAILMFFGIGMAEAQTAYVSVQQNGTKVDAVGTAAFGLSGSPTVEFVDGKAVMTVGSNQVAVLPMSDDGQLAVEFTGTESNVSKTLSNGYATLYSPFQLQVPSTGDVEVYAPTYSENTLHLNADTKVAPGAIIPTGTGLILKNNGTINFTFSTEAATDSHESALSGSALTIEKPVEDGKTVYTLNHESTDNTKYGFFVYNGAYINPGFAYLLAPTLSGSQENNYIMFCFDEEASSINSFDVATNNRLTRKLIQNDRVIILNNGKRYNLNGQRVK